MVISLLLEQVQQHENEYVVTLIKPSTRSFRTALIILHPAKTMAVRVQKSHTWLGNLFLGTVAHTVTAPDTARRVQDLYGITSCPHSCQVYFVFLNNHCYAKMWHVLLG